MGIGEQRRATASSGHVCRSCREPVDAVVKRHKTMGVFVPVWTAGPCHNPLCREYVPEQEPISSTRRGTGFPPTGREGD
ncbi:hypothetical protein C1J00_00750 [Streptomyces cahuitamycinicus]|uniref:Uncharacterized protein n=1 Tax=Streptomyces cahuitamycinicus TaxID=2070367 RepID=A0A2N8TYB6_9ACTN|nr:hypothetical protein C1J00_00750 [Streptomyces cahuitamycinicus]